MSVLPGRPPGYLVNRLSVAYRAKRVRQPHTLYYVLCTMYYVWDDEMDAGVLQPAPAVAGNLPVLPQLVLHAASPLRTAACRHYFDCYLACSAL